MNQVSEFRRVCLTALALLVASVLTSCGEKYTDQGNMLVQEINRELINRGVCESQRDCFNKLPMYGEHGSHVHFNCYEIGPKNKAILSAVIDVAITRGLEITKGVPITIEAFPKSHEEYLKFGSSKKSIIRVEITE